MTKAKRPNWPLLGGLLGGLLVLAVVVYFVHGWQMSRLGQHLLDQVNQAESAGKPAEAIDALERYLTFNPGHLESLARLGKLLHSVADSPVIMARALVVNEKVLERDRANQELRRRVIELSLALGDLDLAEQHIRELRRAVPNDPVAAVKLGDVLLARGETEKAILEYAASKQAQPKQTAAYVRLAGVYQGQKNEELANQQLEEMMAAQPDRAECFLERGRFRLTSGNVTGAAEDFDRARKLAPRDVPPLLAAAELAIGRGLYDDARVLLEQGRKEHPKVLAWYRNGGELALLQGKVDEALQWVKAGQELLPEDPDLWHLRIEASRAKKDLQTVRADLEKLSKLPNFPRLLADYLQGRYQLAREEYSQAARLFQLVLAPGSTANAALRARAALGLADLAAVQGQPDRQIVELQRAIRFDPSLRQPAVTLARLLLAAGRIEDSRKVLEDLTARPEPIPPEAFVELARAWLLTNLTRPEESRNWDAPVKALDRVAELPALRAEAALVRADVLLAQGKPADAEKVLATASKEKPKDASLWAARVTLARQQDDLTRAKNLEAEALRSVDDPTPLWLATLQAGNRVTPAELRAAQTALDAKLPSLPRARQIAILQTLARAGDVARSARRLADLEPADGMSLIPALELALLGRDPDLVARIVKALRKWEGDGSPTAQFGEAAWLVRMGRVMRTDDLVKAQIVLKELASSRPEWAAPVAWLGRIEDLENRPAEAAKFYKQAFDLGDRTPALCLRLLDLLTGDDLSGADAVFRQLEQGGRATGDLARLGADIAQRRGDTERARRLATDARPPGPPSAPYLLWLAAFLNNLGDPAAAIPAVRQAVEIDPVNPEGWVLWVELLVKTNSKSEAEQVLAQILERQPLDFQLVTQARCEVALGRPERAAALFEKALKRDAEDVYALMQAAAFHLAQKDPGRAKPLLERLRRLESRLPEEQVKWVERQLAAL
jgi:tetratricopeptide (TPR) repeat protein